eukprot:TRINITY_DN57448_c0_g1_i1.p1 TRINITY_DN57448_c0_g1~~TRINITY_DN57448_c0_g1_i1.p1  ORF type:complete len:780 (+),score=47.57 TRINITY_DN57448_c0_g1_i1:92-2341(+)
MTDTYKILRAAVKDAKLERAPKFKQYFTGTHSVHLVLDAYWVFFLAEFVDIDVAFLFEDTNQLFKLPTKSSSTSSSRARTPTSGGLQLQSGMAIAQNSLSIPTVSSIEVSSEGSSDDEEDDDDHPPLATSKTQSEGSSTPALPALGGNHVRPIKPTPPPQPPPLLTHPNRHNGQGPGSSFRNRRQVAFTERHSYFHPPLHCKMPLPGTPYTARSRTTAMHFPSPPDVRQPQPRYNRSWAPGNTSPKQRERSTSPISVNSTGMHTSCDGNANSVNDLKSPTPVGKDIFTPTATTLTFCTPTNISKHTMRVKDPEIQQQIWIDQMRLFSRMAQNYTLMFQSLQTQHKDLILKHFPYVVAHTLYLAFYRTLPYFRAMMGPEFRQYLLRNVSYWITGVELTDIGLWENRKKRRLPKRRRKEDKEEAEREAAVLRQKIKAFEEKEKRKREKEFQRKLKTRAQAVAMFQKKQEDLDAVRAARKKKSARVQLPPNEDSSDKQGNKGRNKSDDDDDADDEGDGGPSRPVKAPSLSTAPSSASLVKNVTAKSSFWNNPKLSLTHLRQLGLERKEAHFISSVKAVGAFRSTIRDNQLHNELDSFRNLFTKMRVQSEKEYPLRRGSTMDDDDEDEFDRPTNIKHELELALDRSTGNLPPTDDEGQSSSAGGSPRDNTKDGSTTSSLKRRGSLRNRVDTSNYLPSCRVWYESGKRNNQVYFSHSFHPDFNLTSSSPLIAQYLHDWGVYQNFMAKDIKWSIT